jgi:signal transduction histidine kinase
MVEDDEGWLWFGSDHGIFKVRRLELEQVAEGKLPRVTPIFYGRNEGLFNLQVNYGFWPGAIRTRDGHVAIPTRTALAMIDPTALRRNYKPPKVLFTVVTVDDQMVAAYGDQGTQIVTSRPLHLPPSHHNLKLEFTAFNFSAPENVHFRYRLDDLDNDWQDAKAREAQYSRLAAGDYHFRVEAATGDGAWNEADAPLAIVVDPFFWQTWAFRIGAAVFFVACVVGVVRYVSFRRLRRKLQLLAQQAALDKERTRIARDLHDDLGGRLTEVKQLFELALRNHASPETMQQYLRRGLTKTQSGIQALDETVWAVNPHNDTLPYLIDYIGQSAVEFLRAADIRCRADLPPRPPERVISAEVRHNLFLAMKEALHNVVRHAHASEVQLNAAVTDEALTLTIKDNGEGFERASNNSTEDGLRNMRQRMDEIGGRFSVESRPGAGTSISLVYFWPVQTFGENRKTNRKE